MLDVNLYLTVSLSLLWWRLSPRWSWSTSVTLPGWSRMSHLHTTVLHHTTATQTYYSNPPPPLCKVFTRRSWVQSHFWDTCTSLSLKTKAWFLHKSCLKSSSLCHIVAFLGSNLRTTAHSVSHFIIIASSLTPVLTHKHQDPLCCRSWVRLENFGPLDNSSTAAPTHWISAICVMFQSSWITQGPGHIHTHIPPWHPQAPSGL